ncbi:hypothetical protein FACS1894152_7560 [Bacilli bacterium]|nr:hypothetical protein FACS1894152_7560 [Bacilli bacterium]
MVFVVKYRRKLITEKVESIIKEVCLRISVSYEICFVEIGLDEDHIHLLIQSVPTLSVASIVKTIKAFWREKYF